MRHIYSSLLPFRLCQLGLLHRREHFEYSKYHILYYIIFLTICKGKKSKTKDNIKYKDTKDNINYKDTKDNIN